MLPRSPRAIVCSSATAATPATKSTGSRPSASRARPSRTWPPSCDPNGSMRGSRTRRASGRRRGCRRSSTSRTSRPRKSSCPPPPGARKTSPSTVRVGAIRPSPQSRPTCSPTIRSRSSVRFRSKRAIPSAAANCSTWSAAPVATTRPPTPAKSCSSRTCRTKPAATTPRDPTCAAWRPRSTATGCSTGSRIRRPSGPRPTCPICACRIRTWPTSRLT